MVLCLVYVKYSINVFKRELCKLFVFQVDLRFPVIKIKLYHFNKILGTIMKLLLTGYILYDFIL